MMGEGWGEGISKKTFPMTMRKVKHLVCIVMPDSNCTPFSPSTL